MNNPTTLTDPSGLQGESGQTCGHGFQVPFGQNPATWCYSHEGIGAGSSPGAFFTNTADEFDLMNVPVVVDTWVPPAQIVNTINGVDYPGPLMPGYWTSTQVGTGLDLQIPGVTFTPTGATTATFVSQSSFWPTVGRFVQKGFTPNPFDVLDRYHPHNLDLRDARLVCSKHVDVDWTTGGTGQPTQGSIHVDAVNPNPFWVPPGLNELTYLAHGVVDVFNGGLYPGAEACQ